MNKPSKLPKDPMGYALKYLSFRPRTEKEVRRALAKRQVPENDIEDIIEELLRLGYINDRDFCDSFISHNIRINMRARYVVKRDLFQYGVSTEDVEWAMNEYYPPETEKEVWQNYWQKLKLNLPEGWQKDPKQVRRLIGKAQYKGFAKDIYLPDIMVGDLDKSE